VSTTFYQLILPAGSATEEVMRDQLSKHSWYISSTIKSEVFLTDKPRVLNVVTNYVLM